MLKTVGAFLLRESGAEGPRAMDTKVQATRSSKADMYRTLP